MRKIEPYFDHPPAELWNDATKKRNKSKNNPLGLSAIQLALDQKSNHEAYREVYASPEVKEKLKEIFQHKCAFCETNTYAGAHKDVEHFRPKKLYYWLSYEWSNLLLSCQICNRDNKRTRFPLAEEENRVQVPAIDEHGDLEQFMCRINKMNDIERPLLLHPAIDDPKDHLIFYADGTMEGKTEKGRKTIKIMGLSSRDRDALINARKKVVQDIRKEIWEEYLRKDTLSDDELTTEIYKAIRRLKSRIETHGEYTALAESILENFNEFIIENEDLGIKMPDQDRMKVIASVLLES